VVQHVRTNEYTAADAVISGPGELLARRQPVRSDLGTSEILSIAADPASTSERRESRRRRALAVADLVALTVAWIVSALAAGTGLDAGHLVALAIGLPAWIILNKSLRLYDRDANLLHKSTLNELPTLAQSVTVSAALVFLVAPVLPGGLDIGRAEILAFWGTAMLLVPSSRYSARAVVRRITEPERILIVGSGFVASLVARKISAHPEYGAHVVGAVDVGDSPFMTIDGVEHLGHTGDFEAICAAHDVERVIVAFSSADHESLLDIIRTSKRRNIRISIVPRLFEVFGPAVEVDHVEGMTLLGLRGVRRTKSTLWLKRGLDITVASVALILAAPVLAISMLAIKLTSPGPVLFVQRRIGRGEREFKMLKLRTMVVGADRQKSELLHLNEMDGGPMFKLTDDPRVTRVGRLLRRTSIDELPQLINVLRGEMSVVGPRPLVRDESDHVIGWHRARLDLMPGLTGPWQVMGRNAIPFEEMVKLDYLYVAEWSLWNDIKLLLRTLPVVVGQRGS
jgi:exopolysaccharide biosynthesis polyprenyl glycosylphosphotransferase